MEGMVKILIKQKQLLEIELQEFANNKKAKRPSIHPDTYYAKLGHAYQGIVKAIRMLSSLEPDIYKGLEDKKH